MMIDGTLSVVEDGQDLSASNEHGSMKAGAVAAAALGDTTSAVGALDESQFPECEHHEVIDDAARMFEYGCVAELERCSGGACPGPHIRRSVSKGSGQYRRLARTDTDAVVDAAPDAAADAVAGVVVLGSFAYIQAEGVVDSGLAVELETCSEAASVGSQNWHFASKYCWQHEKAVCTMRWKVH